MHDHEYDAGDQACGELVLLLRQRMLELDPGAVLKLRATDPGGPHDLPAWCRLTGHVLIEMDPPWYWIRRRARDGSR